MKKYIRCQSLVKKPKHYNFISLILRCSHAKNAEGYVVFDENITKDDKETYKNAKELVSFCLVQDSTNSALCGSGGLASDSSQIPYILKVFESMEIGLDNKANEKMLNGSNKFIGQIPERQS